ncbi:MAG: tetraacyldisaccharide 4'-kinase [Nitrospirae bacterium]|nr:tetraacyldisaccharide 4'-kinase [Nitrospirota bacterium]
MGLLSTIYSLILSGRSLFYKTGLKKTKILPAKVISIGNLTLGGTGKTPAVIALAEEIKRQGFNPCILTRGYKGKTKGPCFVKASNELQVTSNKLKKKNSKDSLLVTRYSSLFGDEPVLMAERLKNVPIVKCADRYKGGIFALNSSLVTRHFSLVFILDDGFQHISLHRDIDILLIDATNAFGNGKLFPEGILREPLRAIKRAHVIVLTKTDAISDETFMSQRDTKDNENNPPSPPFSKGGMGGFPGEINVIRTKIRQYNIDAPIYNALHKPESIISADGTIKDLSFINQKKIYAFSGIANPPHFKTMLLSMGANVIRFKTFKDHYKYKQQDIDEIIKEAERLEIITTEKDMVKLKKFKLPENFYALRIAFSIEKAFYNYIFDNITLPTS